MGNAAGLKNRYMGGKVLLKFFKEDTWPTVEEFFTFVDLNESRGFEIFKAFADADKNEDGLVDLKECFHCFGGKRTLFSERILYSESFIDEDGLTRSGLKFKDFALAIWSYCSLSTAGIARYVFEIFDPDGTDFLERADVVAMYRMLWDTDEVEDEYIDIYPFQEYDKVLKGTFLDISAKKRFLIKPAIDYQAKLRKRVGGVAMWEALATYRAKELWVQDDNGASLVDAVDAIIIAARGFSQSRKALTSERILEENKKQIEDDIEVAERELRLRQRQAESEKRMLQSTAPDRSMHQAWSIFLSMKQRFAEEEYLIDDIWRRQQDRQELFELFDVAKRETIDYYNWKDAQDEEVTEGTPADHEARYHDWLLTDEGRGMHQLVTLLRTFEVMEASCIELRARKKKGKGKKSLKHKLIESDLAELRTVYANMKEEDMPKKVYDKRLALLLKREYVDEKVFIKKHATKAELRRAESAVHEELCAEIKERTLETMRRTLKEAREEREKDFVRKEFDVVTKYGSRETKWEFVLDKDHGKMVYVHRDTLEQRHPKTAICEMCDGIFVQHELRCDQCNAARSAKNLKLYRPLGFKDITIE